MVYKKRYNNKRRKNRKINKYAYAKTDSKNQSKQIVYLNKKINRVYRNLKPEIIRINTQGTSTISQSKPVVIPYETLLAASITNVYQGNYARNIYFNFRMYFNPNMRDLTVGHTFRVIVLQTKKGLDVAPTPSDLFENDSLSWGVCMPFRDNISVQFKILLSKVINISTDKDYLYRSYNFKKLIAYKKTEGDLFTFPRGSIFVCALAPNSQAEITFNWTSKLGYVDQYMKPLVVN